jgi:hypothetical protein
MENENQKSIAWSDFDPGMEKSAIENGENEKQ